MNHYKKVSRTHLPALLNPLLSSGQSNAPVLLAPLSNSPAGPVFNVFASLQYNAFAFTSVLSTALESTYLYDLTTLWSQVFEHETTTNSSSKNLQSKTKDKLTSREEPTNLNHLTSITILMTTQVSVAAFSVPFLYSQVPISTPHFSSIL